MHENLADNFIFVSHHNLYYRLDDLGVRVQNRLKLLTEFESVIQKYLLPVDSMLQNIK
jgi:hypothetical protein